MPTTAPRPVRLRDAAGHRVTAATPATITRLDHFTTIVLRRAQGAEIGLDLAVEAPDCPLAQCAAATVHLLSDTANGMVRARGHLYRASRSLGQASPREVLWVEALTAMSEGRARLAALLFLNLAREAPCDRLAAYIGHLHCLNHGFFPEMLALARIGNVANPNDPFMLGMLSFARLQNGAVQAAEEAALGAHALDATIPWVQHALAHIHGETGRLEVGIAHLMEAAPGWATCSTSMETHQWWHLMLFQLMAGDTAPVLAGYDERLAPQAEASLSSWVNAVSMLARLDLLGVDVGARWAPLADVAEARIGEHVLAFLDIHFALALAGAGRIDALDRLRASAESLAEAASVDSKGVWRHAGLPLIDAIRAQATGDREEAARLLAGSRPHWVLIGGSDAQRGLFERLLRAVTAA